MPETPLSKTQTVDFTGVELDQNFSAPFIFVDGVQGFIVTEHGQVRFNLVEDLLMTGPAGAPPLDMPIHRRISARLAMTADQDVQFVPRRAGWYE